MKRVELIVTFQAIEIICNFRRKDGGTERITAVIDTGAELSFFPIELLDILDVRLSSSNPVEVVRAGVKDRIIQSLEGIVTVYQKSAVKRLPSGMGI